MLTRFALFRRPSLLPRTSTRNVFVDVETTPNPHSMKFKPQDKLVLPEAYGTGMFFEKNNSYCNTVHSPLARDIFKINGVKGIFLGRDFITITKHSDDVWNIMKPQLFSKIFDFFANDHKVVEDSPNVSDTTILDTDDEVVATIKELIETRVRPAVQEDGGDIFYKGFDKTTGIVKLRMAGSCVGCPSSSVTLKNGVENMLMHYIPEVKGIEDVTGLDGDEVCDNHGSSGGEKLEFRNEDVSK